MRHGGQLIATPRQSSLYEPCWIFVLSVPGQDSFPSPRWRVWLRTCGGGGQYIDPPSQLWERTASPPRWGGGSNSDRDGCLVMNTDSALWRESCKFSSFPARTRVPASAGGGQKLLLSHSCPRPCGEMRRVLTLRTQDPALPRYQDYFVFSTLTCTHIMNEPLGLELHYIPICFGPIFCTHLFHYIWNGVNWKIINKISILRQYCILCFNMRTADMNLCAKYNRGECRVLHAGGGVWTWCILGAVLVWGGRPG